MMMLKEFELEFLNIITSPEYGAEALKVAAAYLAFRVDIKALGKKIDNYIKSNDERVGKIEKALNPPKVVGEKNE